MNEEQREMFQELSHYLQHYVQCLVEIAEAQQKDIKAIKKLLKSATTDSGSLRVVEVYDNAMD